MITKSGAIWTPLLKFLQPSVVRGALQAGKGVAAGAARGAAKAAPMGLVKYVPKVAPQGAQAAKGIIKYIPKVIPKSGPTSIPIIKDIPMTHSGILRDFFKGTVPNAGKSLRTGIEKLAPEAKKTIANAAKSDLFNVESELSRLAKLRRGGLGPEEYAVLRNRMKELQGVRKSLAANMRNLDRTAWGKTKRGLTYAAGAGMLGMDAAHFGPETYKAIKEKRYGDAALLAGEAALFNAVPLTAFGRSMGGRFGSALERAGRPIESMLHWGERTNGMAGWMARHPVLTMEAAATPLGLNTQVKSMLMPSADKADDIVGKIPKRR